MTKMFNVTIDTSGIDEEEGKAWVDELANIYADMEIDNVSVSRNKISFNAGFSGMDDTQPDDIKMRLDEYLTMNEAFQTKNVVVEAGDYQTEYVSLDEALATKNLELKKKLLELLKSGAVIEFNKLWEINGRPKLDFGKERFSKLNLDGVSLPHFELEQSDFTGTSLEEANLEEANLTAAKLVDVNLRGANLEKANLSHAYARSANLMDTDLIQVSFAGSLFENANFGGANVAGANFHEASLVGASLEGSNLDGANFEFADLSRADLTRANARNCSFKLTKLDSTKLLESDLTGSTDLPITVKEAKARGAIIEERPSVKATAADTQNRNPARKGRKSFDPRQKLESLQKQRLQKYNYDSVELYPDNPTDEDSLSRSTLAELLAHRITKVRKQNPTGSFLINVDGPWGSGKTSFLKLLKKELLKRNDSQKRLDEWVVVEFNAWQNQRIQNPWWSLMDSVWRQSAAHLYLYNYPRYIKIAVYQAVWRSRLRRGRLFAFMTFILFLFGMIVLFGGLDLSDQSKLTEAGKQLIEYLQKISGIVAVIGSFISGILLLRNSLLPSSKSDAAELLKSAEDPMRRLSEHFAKIIEKIRIPIVVFIDDLDRCNEKYTVDFLEGLQTIFRDARVIYIVAADKRWIHLAYEKTYSSFLSVGEPARPLGQLFLSKIFQMSVPIPKMSPDLRKSFFSSLLEGTKPQDEKSKAEEKRQGLRREAEKSQEALVNKIQNEIKSYDNNKLIEYSMQKKGDDAQAAVKAVLRTLEEPKRESETEKNLQKFEHLLEPNPRAIKRLLNTYVIYRAIAIMKRVNLDFDKLTLWTIITMRWPLLCDHLSAHPGDIEKLDTPSGLPTEINRLLDLDKAQIVNVIKGKKIGRRLDAKAIEKLAEIY